MCSHRVIPKEMTLSGTRGDPSIMIGEAGSLPAGKGLCPAFSSLLKVEFPVDKNGQ